MEFVYLTVWPPQVQGQGATDFLQGALPALFRKSPDPVSRASQGSCLRIPSPWPLGFQTVNLGVREHKFADHSKLI